MGRSISGSTDKASAVILGADFWKSGVAITGKYIRSYQVSAGENGNVGDIRQFELVKPTSLEVILDSRGRMSVEGKKQTITRVAVGNLTGFEMALESLKESGFTGFRFGDLVTIECTDVQESSEQGRNAMPKFTVSVER